MALSGGVFGSIMEIDGHILVEQQFPHGPGIYAEFRPTSESQIKPFLDVHPSYTRLYRGGDGSLTLTSYLDPEKITLPAGPINVRRLCELVEAHGVREGLPPIHLKPAPYGEHLLTPEHQMDGSFAAHFTVLVGMGPMGPGHAGFDAKLIDDAIRFFTLDLSSFTHLCYSVDGGKYLYHVGIKGGKSEKSVEDPLSKAKAIRDRMGDFVGSLSKPFIYEASDICDQMDELCAMLERTK